MNIFDYIKDNFKDFTEKEKNIATYLLSVKEDIISLSAKEIGDITKTSAPTVVRFSKKIGFDSFNELKLRMSINLKEKKEASGFLYLDGDLTTTSIIYGIKNSIEETINKTVELIKEKDLEKAIKLLQDANNIYIYAVGGSALVGMDFYYKLSRINKRCISHIDTHLQITTSVLMKPGDVALGISYSGETKEVLKCMENAKSLNVPTIAITKASVNNKLSKISDVTLFIPSLEKSLREGAISSRTAQLAITDMLFIGMAKQNVQEIENMLIKTRIAIQDFK
ncbi:MurR/RpiR family transcriptional regulator [Clostridium fallax]|uniref:Transcriptional regulator, RpiR family n=1 Tax=Clostridium fallax TaxID=1533 RepID=A0A1M4T042_9CLOT|nr:MurR/RpiR family transcriptional regulator [Clostridium fallax]SHE37786.1 transcriptional regulator, RpiR family [Clostridium fallax]SQB08057.1 RpiR family transcriptional regulator [Clostridium fallax]